MNAGTLEIDIRANVARIKADMDETKRVVGSAMKDVEQYVGYAKTAFLALGGVLTVNQFRNFIQSGIEAKSKLYDLSLQTGMTVEVLSGLNRIAKLSNTSLDDIAGASNKLSKSLFTQTEESKGAAQAVRALGLNFDAFKQLRPEEQLQQVAKSLEEFREGSEKGAAAMLLYGKTGAQLLPFFKELAEANTLVGKQTTESARQAKEYEDNLVKLKAAGDAWKREVLDPVLPVLVRITGELVNLRKEADSFNVTGASIKTVFETITVLGANVAFVFAGMGRELGAWGAQIAALGRGDFAGFTAISEAVKADGVRARAELDSLEQRVLGIGPKVSESLKDTRAQPALDSRARLQLDDPAKKEKVADGYDALMSKIREKIALDQAELDAGRKLTEAEKFQIGVYEEVEKNFAKLSIAKLLAIDQATQLAIAKAKEREAFEAEGKYLKEAGADNVRYVEAQMQLRDQLKANRADDELQLRLYGLTAEALQELETARLRAAAAALQLKATQADNAYLEENARLYRDQADALNASADARDRLAAAQTRDRNDPLAGADRAVKEYLTDVTRAGDATYGAVANSIKGLEDLTVTALSGGDAKGAAKAWVNGILSEMNRLLVVKPLLASIFNGGGGGADWSTALRALIGTAGAYADGSYNANYGNEGRNYPMATGTNYVPYDGMRATLHEGEAVVPRAYNPAAGGTPAGGGKAMQINYAPVTNIDSRTDRAEVAQLVAESQRENNRQFFEQLRVQGVL